MLQLRAVAGAVVHVVATLDRQRDLVAQAAEQVGRLRAEAGHHLVGDDRATAAVDLPIAIDLA
ncbi:hypothetical protein D9M69_688820 [compost metagenome]